MADLGNRVPLRDLESDTTGLVERGGESGDFQGCQVGKQRRRLRRRGVLQAEDEDLSNALQLPR